MSSPGTRRRTSIERVGIGLATVVALLSSACTSTERSSSSTTSAPTVTSTEISTSTGAGAPATGTSADCTGELAGPQEHTYRDVPAGVAPELVSLDVYRRPGATGCPVLVWVHGGGWQKGDKRNGIDTKVAYAGQLGAVLVSVNYRLAADDNDVRWPVMGDDVAAATAWVLANAPELGIDASRVALMGHSAGAHLVSIVGTNPRLLADQQRDRSDVRCMVALDTAANDLTQGQTDDADGIFAQAFGADPATLADASPTLQARRHPGAPDFLIVTRGAPGRVASSRAFAGVLRDGGSQATVVAATGYSHEDVNRQLGVPGEELVTPPATAFLSACLRAG